MENEQPFIESDQYQNEREGKITFKSIILNQIQRITVLASKDLRGGYYKEIPVKIKEGIIGFKKVYVEDTKAAYSNAVDALHDLLVFNFDSPMKKSSQSLSEKEDIKSKRKLFQELSKFIQRAKVLKAKTYEY